MKISRRSIVGPALAAALLPAGSTLASAADKSSLAGNVREFGALGDGKTDDTAAVLKCIKDAIARGGGCAYFPAGNYVLSAPIAIASQVPIDLVGDGQSSTLIWKHEGHAIWWKGVSANRSSVRNLRIAAMGTKSATSAAICCESGASDCSFENVWIESHESEHFAVPVGMQFGDGKWVTDKAANWIINVNVRDCFFQDISHVGLTVGAGGEFRVEGGRFVSASAATSGYQEGSVAIRLMGWMGGFHVTDTDVSLFETAMQIGDPAAIQNREIFITHATFDSSRNGLVVHDNSYVSIAGCWAASCKDAQIVVDEGSPYGKLVIVGGTIFNGGRNPSGNLAGGAGNGIIVRSGGLVMSGVYVRSNVGCPIDLSGNVKYAISGCIFEDNGKPVVIGTSGARSGNVGI